MSSGVRKIAENTEKPRRVKSQNRQNHEKEIEDFSSRIKATEEELKSLILKVPDKEAYTAQRNEDIANLSDVKSRRENQFKEKRIVDAELKEVNQELPIKNDAIGKLKSTLEYKNSEKVDDVIRKRKAQMQKMQMKASDERRYLQEIKDLEGSKEKIQDFEKLQAEVAVLRERQKKLRDQRDENVCLIKAVKQEEAAARLLLEEHKQIEDEDWTIYKGKLTLREKLRKDREDLLKSKRELSDRYNQNDSAHCEHLSRKDSLKEWAHHLLGGDIDIKRREAKSGHHRIITERRKPFDGQINLCNILLEYLKKHDSQPSNEIKETYSVTERHSLRNVSEPQMIVKDDIYQGVRRRPSKRERRRKQHGSEAAKKLQHDVGVLERFISLGVDPPATVADVRATLRAIRDKKKNLKEEQRILITKLEIKRTKSSPFINRTSLAYGTNTSTTLYTEPRIQDDMLEKRRGLNLALHKRHKSCPSLLAENITNYGEFESPSSSLTKDFSASNSEYEMDSPRSVTSSTGFNDTKSDQRRSVNIDEDSKIPFEDLYFMEFKPFASNTRSVAKPHHKVHFANHILVDKIELESGDTLENSDGENEMQKLDRKSDVYVEVISSSRNELDEAYNADFADPKQPAKPTTEDVPVTDSMLQQGNVANMEKERSPHLEDELSSNQIHKGMEKNQILQHENELPSNQIHNGLDFNLKKMLAADKQIHLISSNGENEMNTNIEKKECNLTGLEKICIPTNDKASKVEPQFSTDDKTPNGGTQIELQFSIDDMPLTVKNYTRGQSENTSDSSLRDSPDDGSVNDVELLFPIELSNPDRKLRSGDSFERLNDCGHNVIEALPRRPPSSTGCSPRRSNNDFHIEENGDDTVKVAT